MESNVLNNHLIIRNKILDLVSDISEERMLKTPNGLANNILWIFGHVIRSTDFLVLKANGRDMNFPEPLDSYFAKGSHPKDWKNTQGLKDSVFVAEKHCREELVKFLTSEKMAEQFKTPYKTSMGITLNTLGDAIEYATLHEALHLGQLQIYAKLTEE